MIRDVNNVIRVPSALDTNFFRYWLEFIKPFHHMVPREMDVVSELLKNRYELSKVITDPNLLERVALNSDSQGKAREACGLTSQHFQVIMSKLRKAGVIEEGKINPRFIPNIKEDAEDGTFKLLLIFGL